MSEIENIKEYVKPRSGLLIILITFIILIFLLLVFTNRRSQVSQTKNEQVTIQVEDSEVTFYKGGLVEIKTRDGLFQKVWGEEKIRSIFQYAKAKVDAAKNVNQGYLLIVTIDGNSTSVVVNQDDAVINSIINELNGGSGGGSGGSGGSGNGNNYFQPTPTSSTSISTPTPTQGGGGPGGCQFWKLSWCIFFPSPTPTPVTVNPTPTVYLQTVPDCDLYNQVVTNRTIISNTLCIINQNP